MGNETQLLTWLAAGSHRPGRIIQPPAEPEPEPEVVLDWVGGLENAATVIAALHRGQKRLVFCDSRAGVEQLATALRRQHVTTFVAHSSLSRDERRQAEEVFAQGRDCVIVATSALELGIDVGDLDRVIQIDAPGTVSSFLQRMGRTGRRAGTARNCLFLATTEAGLLRAAGLIALWQAGHVEPATPPPLPLHILAQQLLALALQERGIGRTEWLDWVRAVPAFRQVSATTIATLVNHMLARQILWDEAGVLWLGHTGQETYGRRNFLELVSVFTAPPMFTVLFGRRELGMVDESTFLARRDGGPPVLLLAGHAWRVTHLDWKCRKAHVEPAAEEGRSRWRGEGQWLHRELCEAIRRVLARDDASLTWSRRTVAHMDEMRAAYPWLHDAGAENVLVASGADLAWWTFAGGRANATLAMELARRLDVRVTSDNFAVHVPPGPDSGRVAQQVRDLAAAESAQLAPAVSENAIDGLKFAECLPRDLAIRVVQARLSDPAGVAEAIARTTRCVIDGT